MDATKPKELRQDSSRQDSSGKDSSGHKVSGLQNELDRRYGKIGISAVAAAVRCKGEEPRKSEPRSEPFDRD